MKYKNCAKREVEVTVIFLFSVKTPIPRRGQEFIKVLKQLNISLEHTNHRKSSPLIIDYEAKLRKAVYLEAYHRVYNQLSGRSSSHDYCYPDDPASQPTHSLCPLFLSSFFWPYLLLWEGFKVVVGKVRQSSVGQLTLFTPSQHP